MFTVYVAVKAMDMVQTRKIYDDENLKEGNGLLRRMSKDQATAFMVADVLFIYALADTFPKARSAIIFLPLAFTTICVLNNFSIGVTF